MLALGLVIFDVEKFALPGWNAFASICAEGTAVGKTPACQDHPTLRVTTGGRSGWTCCQNEHDSCVFWWDVVGPVAFRACAFN
eukprot:s6_g14.t1